MEVLIATAILAIGILAIMALFPIGAVNMARAINQNRAADHAQNSDALFRLYWKRAWLDPNGGGLRSSGNDAYAATVAAGSPEDMIALLDRPRPITPTYMIPATSSQPSFPVLVDPVGWRTQPGPRQLSIDGQSFLPVRTNLAATPFPSLDQYQLRATVRNTTMLDEFTYDGNGEPANLGGGQLERGGRYNTSWLIQLPKNNVPDEVNLTVLVFAGRSPTDTPSAEQVLRAVALDYAPQVDPKPRSLIVTLAGTKPAAIRGKWLAFSTPVQPMPAPPNNVPQGTPGFGVQYPAFDFYRISAVTEIDDNTLNIELEQPLRTYDLGTPLGAGLPGWQQTSANPVNGNLNGFVVFFDNLFEVFDRGTVSASGIAGR